MRNGPVYKSNLLNSLTLHGIAGRLQIVVCCETVHMVTLIMYIFNISN